MPYRSYLPQKERRCRSRLMFLLQQGAIMRGSRSVLRNTCGKPSCRCARGQKHESLYVAQSRGGKRYARCVPKPLWELVAEWINRYNEIQQLLEELSGHCWQQLEEQKRKR